MPILPSDYIEIFLLLITIVGFLYSRSRDRKKDEEDRAKRLFNDQKEHEHTRSHIKDLTHALELRIQRTEGEVEKFNDQIRNNEVKVHQLEKEVIQIQANQRRPT